MDFNQILPLLLGLAWLLPLASFALIVLFGPRMGKAGHGAGYVATFAIVAGFVLSATALVLWLMHHQLPVAGHGVGSHGGGSALPVSAVAGDWYSLGEFGNVAVTIGYYIDSLTIAMFCMVTLVASCIHVYSIGYMHDDCTT